MHETVCGTAPAHGMRRDPLDRLAGHDELRGAPWRRRRQKETRMAESVPGMASTGTLEHDARLVTADTGHISPGEIALGVVIGRTSEAFDFFVFGIACVLVFPALIFPFTDAADRDDLFVHGVQPGLRGSPCRLHHLPRDRPAIRTRRQAHHGAVPARGLHGRHGLPACLRRLGLGLDRAPLPVAYRSGPGARRCLGRIGVVAGPQCSP